jgi:acetoacetate decarboxylase
MKIADVKKRAYAMPLTSPAFPPGPYRFIDREYLIITYRTDKAALEAVVPEPLTFDEPLVKYEFIRMPDSTGFGDYTESGQVIPVKYNGTARRSTAVANFGASRKNTRSRRSGPTRIRSLARSITEASGSPPGRWASSTRRQT